MVYFWLNHIVFNRFDRVETQPMNLPPNEILSDGLERILAALDEVTDNPQLRIFILVNSLVCDAIESRRDEISWDEVKLILCEAVSATVDEMKPLAESLLPSG